MIYFKQGFVTFNRKEIERNSCMESRGNIYISTNKAIFEFSDYNVYIIYFFCKWALDKQYILVDKLTFEVHK